MAVCAPRCSQKLRIIRDEDYVGVRDESDEKDRQL